LESSNLGNNRNAVLKDRKKDSMTVFVRKIEILTKNILRHKLKGKNLKVFKKEIEMECAAAMNKQKCYARAARFKDVRRRLRVEFGFKLLQSSKIKSKWQPKSSATYAQKNRYLGDKQERNTKAYNHQYQQNTY